MKILENIAVPTGNILIVEGEYGKLEMLSLGDYGKDHNLKCDAIGLSRELTKVEHTKMLPLEEKWVITISTQYGCICDCKFCSPAGTKVNTPYGERDIETLYNFSCLPSHNYFSHNVLVHNCDVPKVGTGRNATGRDLINQVKIGLSLHPEVEGTKRLNIHYARMGEPTFNPNVLFSARYFKANYNPEFHIHPVVSTVMPRYNAYLKLFIHDWMEIKNDLYEGEAGLQLSINSTNEKEREIMFNGNACTLAEIADIMSGLIPKGRKITLNFALCDYEIDEKVLVKHFDPKYYIVKITPMHKTNTALQNGIETPGDYTT